MSQNSVQFIEARKRDVWREVRSGPCGFRNGGVFSSEMMLNRVIRGCDRGGAREGYGTLGGILKSLEQEGSGVIRHELQI